MGYRFTGFFANEPSPGDTLFAEVSQIWPDTRRRKFHEPFQGFGVLYPDYQESFSESEADQILELVESARQRLPALSRSYPQITFMWVEADCFGGTCFYEGFVCQGGEIQEEASGCGALGKLLAHFDVKVDEREYFAPFQKGFFSEI